MLAAVVFASADRHAHALSRNRRHATSLEEDEVLLAGQQQQALSPRIAAAVVARLERKRLIAAARSVLVAYGTGQQQ